jgi:CMP-N-acetylneuraminic acid synthetase
MQYGAAVIHRPDDLAEVAGAVDVGTQEVARHALSKMLLYGLDVEYACCIYATAPFLRFNDLQIAFADLKDSGKPFVYMDGQFYWGHTQAFIDRVPLTQGWQQNTDYLDINTDADWQLVEKAYANRGVLVGDRR